MIDIIFQVSMDKEKEAETVQNQIDKSGNWDTEFQEFRLNKQD